MSLADYSDRMVFALAMVGVPHLQRIHQPGHRSLLVSWTRAGHGQIPLPTATDVTNGVANAHQGTVAVVAPSIQPRSWQMIGKTALSLVRSLPDLDDHAIINSILSQEPVDQTAYHEIGSRDRVVGFLRLPVMGSNPIEKLWIIGVQAVRAYPADLPVPDELPQEMDLH